MSAHNALHIAVLAGDGITVVHIVGEALLWLLRLALAPPSTLKGFHVWVKSLPAAPPLRQAADDEQPKVVVDRPEEVKGPKRERPAIRSAAAPARPGRFLNRAETLRDTSGPVAWSGWAPA